MLDKYLEGLVEESLYKIKERELQNKLKNRFEIAKLKCENEFGGQTYIVSKKYLSILKAKRSEKQIQTSRENIRKAFDKRKRLDFETRRAPE